MHLSSHFKTTDDYETEITLQHKLGLRFSRIRLFTFSRGEQEDSFQRLDERCCLLPANANGIFWETVEREMKLVHNFGKLCHKYRV